MRFVVNSRLERRYVKRQRRHKESQNDVELVPREVGEMQHGSMNRQQPDLPVPSSLLLSVDNKSLCRVARTENEIKELIKLGFISADGLWERREILNYRFPAPRMPKGGE